MMLLPLTLGSIFVWLFVLHLLAWSLRWMKQDQENHAEKEISKMSSCGKKSSTRNYRVPTGRISLTLVEMFKPRSSDTSRYIIITQDVKMWTKYSQYDKTWSNYSLKKQIQILTLPTASIAPGNRPLEKIGKGDSYWKPPFSGCYVSFREGSY